MPFVPRTLAPTARRVSTAETIKDDRTFAIKSTSWDPVTKHLQIAKRSNHKYPGGKANLTRLLEERARSGCSSLTKRIASYRQTTAELEKRALPTEAMVFQKTLAGTTGIEVRILDWYYKG